MRKVFPFLGILLFLGATFTGGAHAQFDRPEHGGEFLQEMGNVRERDAITKAPYFTVDDLYYFDRNGERVGLNLSLRECALRLRDGVESEAVESSLKADERVYSLERLEHLGIYLIVLEYRFRKEREVLKLINDLNRRLDEYAIILPVFVEGKKKEILSNEFIVKFKSFVSKNDVKSMNLRNRVGFVSVEEGEEGDTYRLKKDSMVERNVLQMVHLYHEDPLVKYAEPIFTSIKRPIRVISRLERTTTEVGDPARYHLFILHDEDITVDWSFLDKNAVDMMPMDLSEETFEIEKEETHEPLEVDGQILESRTYDLVFYSVGEFDIPPVTVYYTKKGKENEVLEELAGAVTIKVASLIPSGMSDINGVVNEVSYAELIKASKFPRFQLLLGSSLMAASVVLFVVYRRRAASTGTDAVEVEPSREGEAIRELHRLINMADDGMLTDRESLERFYDDVNRGYRRALRAVCKFDAEAGSVTRVLHEMDRMGLDGGLRSVTEKILNEFCNRRFLPRKGLEVVGDQEFKRSLGELKAGVGILESVSAAGPDSEGKVNDGINHAL